jgi:DNA polymerase III delta subunit
VIELLCGDNDFELTKKVAQLQADFDGRAERYEAVDLTLEKLADVFGGQTLFAAHRLAIIDSPSAYSELWLNLSSWAGRLAEGTELVLVEPKPDKRTSTYKWLQKNAKVTQFDRLDPRDARGIATWLESYAKQQGVALSRQQVQRLVGRGGAEQWTLADAVDKLGLLEEVTDKWIDDIVKPQPSESVFALFETALNGDTVRVQQMLETLRLTEEPYRVFGLVGSQAMQLVTLIYGGGNATKVANDSAAKSAYPYQKLSQYASRISKRQAGELITLLAAADLRLKSSDANPWTVLESSLVQLASLVSR